MKKVIVMLLLAAVAIMPFAGCKTNKKYLKRAKVELPPLPPTTPPKARKPGFKPRIVQMVETNIAPQGTGYIWYTLSSATGTGNQLADERVNDGLTNSFMMLSGLTTDTSNKYEAAGVVWATNRNITKVVFKSGSYITGGDGVFAANLKLQTTVNGTTWVNSTWTNNPIYPYNTTAAADATYSFTGAVTNVRGVRICGQVHTGNDPTNSWVCNVREVQAFGLVSNAFPCQGAVTLAWDPSPGTNIIAGYRIYYGVASHTYTNIVEAGTALYCTVQNLACGVTYYFAATAFDTSALESDFSGEVSCLLSTNYIVRTNTVAVLDTQYQSSPTNWVTVDSWFIYITNGVPPKAFYRTMLISNGPPPATYNLAIQQKTNLVGGTWTNARMLMGVPNATYRQKMTLLP